MFETKIETVAANTLFAGQVALYRGIWDVVKYVQHNGGYVEVFFENRPTTMASYHPDEPVRVRRDR